MPNPSLTNSTVETLIRSGKPSVGEHLLATKTVPRILVVDDQKEILQTVCLMLEGEFDIIGFAENGILAIELATSLLPDVMVLDIAMPIVNGLEAARRLKDIGLGPRIVFLTLYADDEFVEAALSLGALGYVLKTSLATDLVPAIRAVLDGHIYVSPCMRLH